MEQHKEPKVFISYSWDSKEHKEWVKVLSDRLTAEGVNVILDQTDCLPGTDFLYFMEQAIEKSEKTLLILTNNYCEKVNNRIKGVGYEGSIISAHIYMQDVNQRRFIPIIKSGDEESSIPTFIRHITPIDMRKKETFEQNFELLLKTIFNDLNKRSISEASDYLLQGQRDAIEHLPFDLSGEKSIALKRNIWNIFFQKNTLKEDLGIRITVNCNRKKHYAYGLYRKFTEHMADPQNFVFFLSACLYQRPSSLAKRLIYELSEKGVKIAYFQDANVPGEAFIAELKFGLSPIFTWIEYWKVVQMKFVTEAVTPEQMALNEMCKEKDRIALVFRITEKKWEEPDIEKHLEFIIGKFMNMSTNSRKYLLFFVFEFKHVHSIRQAECQEYLKLLDLLEHRINLDKSNNLLAGHYKLFPPVDSDDVEIWFDDVAASPQKVSNIELISTIKTQVHNDDRDNPEFDMEIVEFMQESAWKFVTRPRSDLDF